MGRDFPGAEKRQKEALHLPSKRVLLRGVSHVLVLDLDLDLHGWAAGEAVSQALRAQDFPVQQERERAGRPLADESHGRGRVHGGGGPAGEAQQWFLRGRGGGGGDRAARGRTAEAKGHPRRRLSARARAAVPWEAARDPRQPQRQRREVAVSWGAARTRIATDFLSRKRRTETVS